MFATILAITLMSMVNGMKDQMVDSIVQNTTGHLQIQDVMYNDEPTMDHALGYEQEVKAALEKYSADIDYIVPRIHGFCLASKGMSTRGVKVMGVEAQKEDQMNSLSSRLIKGSMFEPRDDFAVIGKGVAEQLDLSLGDTIVLLGRGFQGMTAAGKFKIGGVLAFPLPEQNNTLVYLPLDIAQGFFAAPQRLTNLIIMTKQKDLVPELAEKLNAELDDEWYRVLTWEELMPDKVAAFEARDAQVSVFAWILYIVAGFGIFGTVITMMFERVREFGILLSIGLKRIRLSIICILETIFVSFIGVLAGIALGFPIMFWLYKHPIPMADDLGDVMIDMGIEPVMSFSISPDIFISQAINIFFIALIVGMYPVYKVFRLDMGSSSRK